MAHIDPTQITLEASWKKALYDEFSQDYFAHIKQALLDAKARGEHVFPPGKWIFNAFDRTPLSEVKVVILGQDPYHRAGQAMGLSFSVPEGVTIPPSLRNIYKELARSIEGFNTPKHGDLSAWADQGALLLNASLTVLEGRAGSHSKIGWQRFTDRVIETISREREGIIFLLWGNFAKQKAALIDQDKHHILTAVHPSPLNGNAFIGCDHFRATNHLLEQAGKVPIDWQI
ncbi:uracil-DNA glycosylase [Suttonella sp. R2A3]|uniref:uracil-DNA glycosylase n=1 Tax=Suttonella sp. R2A3 TaxID=2908648 RepID=UPI001F1A4B54|nr:uracil-DNA glycosylase [Suttonella sp. R2A3]UJF23716.1 uracil-DNA glycosylase [Suttonella sp. R2A3]